MVYCQVKWSTALPADLQERNHHNERDILDDGHGNPIGDAELERIIYQNESNNIYDTLRRAFSGMSRRDLTEKVGLGMNLDQFRPEFDF